MTQTGTALFVDDGEHRRQKEHRAQQTVESVLEPKSQQHHRLSLGQPEPSARDAVEPFPGADPEENRGRDGMDRMRRGAPDPAQRRGRHDVEDDEAGQWLPPSVRSDPVPGEVGERSGAYRVEQADRPDVRAVARFVGLGGKVRDRENDPIDREGSQSQLEEAPSARLAEVPTSRLP
jgi:hypothetical protein